MKKNILEFITVIKHKNGELKITHNLENEANIYKLLREWGFRKSTFKGKKNYFKETIDQKTPVSIIQMRDAFWDFLENEEFINLPEEFSKNDLLNWFLEKNPIRENTLLAHYLQD